MTTSRDTELPVPMRASEFAEEFIAEARDSGFGDRIGVSTMQLAPQFDLEKSKVMEIVDEMLAANDRGAETHVTVDIAYVNRMTRIGNRDFPDFLPVLSAKSRAERGQNKADRDENKIKSLKERVERLENIEIEAKIVNSTDHERPLRK